MNRNCPNCGAPYDVNLDTCPYCKTSYFDMTAIDVTEHEPFYLKLRVYGGVITAKVMVADASININEDSVVCVNRSGSAIQRFMTNKTCDISMTFESVPDKENVLFKYREIENFVDVKDIVPDEDRNSMFDAKSEGDNKC